MMSDRAYPKILYMSDVPVELSFAGATLMFRLFEHYPKDRLLIIQGASVNAHSRIPGVMYISWVNNWIEKLRRTRFFKYAYILDLILRRVPLPKKIIQAIKKFSPDVVVTVTFKTAWISAWQYSKRAKLPLHLILHDEILLTENYFILNKIFVTQFKAAYDEASSRICISSKMEQYYFEKFKRHGSVIPPFFGKEDLISPLDPVKFNKTRLLAFCYAGSLSTVDFLPMLNDFAGVIEEDGGTLTIFSNVSKEGMAGFPNLLKGHVRVNALVDPVVLRKFMLENIDVNLVLNSFEQQEPFQYNFSSKVVDYTGVMVPILFWGPLTSGVIDWASHANYGMIVAERKLEKLRSMLTKAQEPGFRFSCARIMETSFVSYLNYEDNYSKFTGLLRKSLDIHATNS